LQESNTVKQNMNLRIVIEKIKARINRFLEGTYNHFDCRLPVNSGFIRSFIYKQLFSRIHFLNEYAELIKRLPDDTVIVYISKFKSVFEYLFSYYRYSTLSIPSPTIAVGYRLLLLQSFKQFIRILYVKSHHILFFKPQPDLFKEGFLEQRLLMGETAFLSLVEKHDFYQRFVRQKIDPLTYLIEVQKKIDRPIYIIPQLFFYSNRPASSTPKLTDIFFGSEIKPGMIRRLYKALIKPEKMFVELSQPIHLKEFLSHHSALSSLNTTHSALILRRNLLSQINRHRQSVTGPVLKSFDEIKQGILTNDELQDYMKKYAKRKNVSLSSARRKAVEFFDEIAAKYRPGFIGLSVRILQWISGTVFEGIHIDKKKIETIKRMALKGPVIFVPCHRSHIDSMIMLFLMYQNHMSPPHFFAGKNLSFWPLGPVLRMAGVFFVRRSFKGAVFYTKVFSAYIYKLLAEGFHITVFIEGTRSRTGKLLQPQLGMIKILLHAFQQNACKDLIFVPVYIGYDRVPEEKDYLYEMEGGQKQPESAKQILKFGKLLKKRFGKIYITFDDPIALLTVIEQTNHNPENLSSKQVHQICRYMGNKIMTAIDQTTIVSPRALVAGALLNSNAAVRSYDHLVKHIDTYLDFLISREVPLSEPLRNGPQRAANHILSLYAQGKIIETIHKTPGEWRSDDKIKVRPNKRPLLEYYKNNCISHFIPPAYTAIAIMSKDNFLFNTSDIVSDYIFLQDFFVLEFISDNEQQPHFYLRKSIKAFIDNAVLVPHPTQPDTYSVTSPGYRKLKQFALFLTPFFESYWIVLKYLSQRPHTPKRSKDQLKKIISLGHQMYKNREIEHIESLSRMNMENAVAYYKKNGLRGSEDIEGIRSYEKRITVYRNCLNG